MTVPARCAVHPARPAVDACPRCGRARCGPDAEQYVHRGCGVCVAEHATEPVPARGLEIVTRSGLGAYFVALIGGWIGTQYVDVHQFSVIVPGLVGLASGWAATASAGRGLPKGVQRKLLVIGAAGAVISAGLAFRLQSGGGQDPLASWGESGPPYLAAVIGTLVWPVLFGSTPNPRRRRQRGSGSS